MSKPFPLTRRAVGVCSLAVLAASIAWAPLQAQAQSRKDTVILGMILEPTSLDPTMAPAAAIGEVVHYNILEGLTKINVDGSITPLLAESWKMDADGKASTKQLGIKFTLLPKVTGEDRIDLHVAPQITGFDGFMNHATGVKQPIFSERKLTANVSITSGQTVVLGFPAHSAKQTTEERSAGRITTKTENVNRHTMVFVTARLVDPATGNAF